MKMEKYRNIKEIIELLEDELDDNNENVSATLDLEDLLELRELLKEVNKITDEEWEKAAEHTYRMLTAAISIPTGFFYVQGCKALLDRYESGERTEELYKEMIGLE